MAVFVGKKKEEGGIVMQSWQSVVLMVTADDYYVQVAGVVLGLSESLPAAGILRMSIRWKGKVYCSFCKDTQWSVVVHSAYKTFQICALNVGNIVWSRLYVYVA